MVDSIVEPLFLFPLWDRCKVKGIFVTVSGNFAFQCERSQFHCMELYYNAVPATEEMQIKQLCTETITIWSGFVPGWLKINEYKLTKE